MEPYHWFLVAIGAAGVILPGIGLTIGGTWKLAQMEARIIKTITLHRAEIDVHMDKIAGEAVMRADSVRREFGETVGAMQKKIQEIEIWSRDMFVRRDSFYKVTDEIKKAINDQGDKIDVCLNRMNIKLDDLQNAKPSRGVRS